MKIFLFIFLLLSTPCWATTWYVLDNGGSVYGTSQATNTCNGQTNVPYSFGASPNCALSHPSLVIGAGFNGDGTGPAQWSAGDTLNISGDSGLTPGTQAQYQIGWGMPNSGDCSSTFAYACLLDTVPQGSSSSVRTTIIGTGTHQPQLWGTQGITQVLDLSGGGHYDIENLEITQHSSCSNALVSGSTGWCGGTGGSYPFGTWAKDGILLEGTDIVTKNLWVHNIGDSALEFPGLVSEWSSTNDRFIASGNSLTDGGSMTFGGTNTMTNDVWAFGGCMENYPLPDPQNIKDLSNYTNCADQNYANAYGGFALGGGFMMQNNGHAACGNWNINGSQFLFNLKTNIDFLHCDGTGTFNMYRSRSEGSSGEALKANVATVNVESSQLIGNAPVWETTPFEAIKASPPSGSWDYFTCRGNAVTIFQVENSEQVNYVNDDVSGNCTALIETGNGTAAGCSGMGINATNTKFLGGYGYDISANVDLYYDGSSGGSCGGSVPLTLVNNSCNNASSFGGYSCTSGTNTVSSDPKVVGETNLGSFSAWLGPTTYYSGTSLGDQLYLQSSSPLKAAGGSPTFTNGSSNDYNNIIGNSPLDIGAIRFGSTIPTSTGITNGFCSIANQCTSGNCNASGYCSSSNVGDSISGNIKITGSINF